jgi:non-specific serine/threonine protein kinase
VVDNDPSRTQHDAGLAVAKELIAAGFDDAEEVGRGGFGVVYRCAQPDLDRTVAVKVLTASLNEDRERFLREQRAMGRLTGHSNIVGVLQVGETTSGRPYLVMPFQGQGSLHTRIREAGPLPLEEALRLGVKIAGALECAHRLGIVHRDVTPGNVLLTDFGEPALGDFGIAHIPAGFTTTHGVVSGSPAFTAPEVLSGGAPTVAADVYGLGATLFCALTGHAAFQRRTEEDVITQFLRIAGESAPDPRESNIPDDVSAVVQRAMSRDADERPSAVALGEELQRLQDRYGFPVTEMALVGEPHARAERPARRAAARARAGRTVGNIPLELTSFVGRRGELSDVKQLLSSSRLVTLTGIGGVGKTRLSLRAAGEMRQDFADGAWLAELGEVHDGSLVAEVVASALGVRDESDRPLAEVLVEFLAARELLLVLDNCEQVVDATAKLAETLLRGCAGLRILATSREALDIGAEAVLPLSPLACPDADDDPTLGGLPGYDAVALFAERAAASVRGFSLTDDNKATVARICSKLDGLPLAIELAAARLKAMSPQQILERLADRYVLLTRGSRGAPTRQQTLAFSVGWSYDLCTPAEQQLWCRLSVFAGGFELQAAEDICGGGLNSGGLVDLVSSLVDKSILIRSEFDGVVRFRFLEILREYGRQQIRETGDYAELRRRHADWYQRLARRAAAEWVSPQQVDWIRRLERELVNVGEALGFMLSDDSLAALEMAADLSMFWLTQGLLGVGRRWLDEALATAPPDPTTERIEALYNACLLAGLQGDPQTAVARGQELGALVEDVVDPTAHALADIASGFSALFGGDLFRACEVLTNSVDTCEDLTTQIQALIVLGWAHALRGKVVEALAVNEKALALTESHGESAFRVVVLWTTGTTKWLAGDFDGGVEFLEQGLRLAPELNDRRTAASCLETLAWIAGETGQPRRAVVLMAAARALGAAVNSSVVVFPTLLEYKADCERRVRNTLDADDFDTAHQQGSSLTFDEAVAYALGE